MTDVPNDDAIQIAKKRKADELLDGSEDGTNEDENGKGKDIDQDDVIQIEKKRKANELLDGSEDGSDEDENGKGKDIAQAEDDTDSAAKITTPSKTHEVTKRTSTRGRPIGSGTKKGCSPPHILFLFINHFLICCLFLSRPQVSYGKIPGVGQFTHVHK